ncbi:hypothetical protein CSUI_001726 [Cystoisospora suis]|uniref:ubiquitinyl hydrolase 1 n=1 Tax=Cystoisospora suis TaxID=483139 RepID=A0A2C6L7H2_9APIC|nr:hypothetical protein CSUI_001726 [Cystoisospora suis]
MDTRDHPLLGVYGHCSQELVNLLLLGMSTSNVFDGTKNLGKILPPPQGEEEEESALSTASREGGDGVHTVLRGIPKRPLVGFLTEMEALRYCEVGSGYKNPFLPVWVLGSGNHYTTLFSRDLLVSYLSPPRLAEMEAQAAFRVVDEENNMYIRSQQLPSLLALLGIEEREQEARRAIGAVDGVILWSEFLSWYTSFLLSHLQSQRSPSDETSMLQSPRTFTVYFYDGQTPPGPSLRRFLIRLHEDVDLRYSHHPGSYELSRILWTRWNSAEISQLSLLSPLLDLSSLGQDLHAASSSS